MAAIRVFLLDDHEIVRRGLRELLEREDDIEVVGESGEAEQARRRIPALRPDVAILDARLPDGSGIDVCRDVRSIDPTIKALILTSYDDDEALFAAIMAGAAGYVLKQVRSSELVEGVRRLVSPTDVAGPQLLVFGVVGLLGNVAAIVVLAPGRSGSLNRRAAFLEVVNDALGSVAVIVAAVVIALTGWTRADAVAGLLIGVLILPRTLALLRETIDVLREGGGVAIPRR